MSSTVESSLNEILMLRIFTLGAGILSSFLIPFCTFKVVANSAAPQPSKIPEQLFLFDDHQITDTYTTADGEITFEVYAGYAIIEGDIMLAYSDSLLNRNRSQLRGLGRESKLDRWINGQAYYVIDPAFEQAERDKILSAISHWNTLSSITLVERTEDLQETVNDYINFTLEDGCASWVGKIGGAQDLFVSTACPTGSVIHEIGHALGLFHEHTREDRDNFITIDTGNIIPGKEFNFDIISDGLTPLGDYDYGSIMHYGDSFFSVDGKPTITVPDGIEIGQREGLSALDLAAIDSMYGTDLALINNITANSDSTKTIDAIVTNNATSGAHELVYSLALTNGANVLSIDGSGWDCDVSGTKLSCTLPVLAEADSASIEIQLSDAEDSIIDTANLTSKTFDTDLSNNGKPLPDPRDPDESGSQTPVDLDPVEPDPIEPDPVEPDPITPDTTPPDNTTLPDMTTPETKEPDPAPVNEAETPDISAATNPATGDSGGGGSLSWLLAALAVLRRPDKYFNR